MKISFFKKLFTYHILFWASFTVLNYFVSRLQWGEAYIEDSIAKYLIAAIVFYSNDLLIYPSYYRKRNRLLLIIESGILLVSTFYLKEFILTVIYPNLFNWPVDSDLTKFDALIVHTWWWYQYSFLAVGYWFAKLAIRKEKEKSKLEQERSKLETEKIQIEYDRLTAQINPHFLYNVMNSLYSQALVVSETLAEGIMALSDIMRYTLVFGKDGNQVSILEELVQIDNYILLNQRRFNNGLIIEVEKIGKYEEVRIIPFILFTLVENAFKHGNEMEPIYIRIEYRSESNELFLSVKNYKIDPCMKIHSTGIGLVNLEERLRYVYPNKHQVKISNHENSFTISISINYD